MVVMAEKVKRPPARATKGPRRQPRAAPALRAAAARAKKGHAGHKNAGRPLPKKALRFLASASETPSHFDHVEHSPPFVPRDD